MFLDHPLTTSKAPCLIFKFSDEGSFFEDASKKIELPLELHNACKKRKSTYIAGRLCCNKLIKRITNEPHSLLPSKIGTPIWPKGIVGSISHTQTIAVATIALEKNYQSMGIDVETILDQKKYFKLKSRILTSNESSLFRSIKIAEHIYGSLIFSAKESLFKALYPLVEKYFYFKDAEIIKINILSCDHEIISGRFKITLLKDLNTDFTSGSHIWGSFFIDLNRDKLVHTSISI